ncbi:CopD family protein [Phenylobacterium sp.]|uniref:CopD family protein n=1 Tax=Phenylobacterium sp. TaxID=1871053 RepID=UPI0035B32251
MDELTLARVLHVLGVVVWIGGVSMVTTVVLPAVRRGALGEDRLKAFEAFERRFIWQARVAVIVVGLSGLYMTARLGLWDRFADPRYWWMHAMVGVWLLFALILFVGEPLVLHRIFPAWARRDPERAFSVFQRMHVALLVLSLVTVFGAVAGSHGWLFP